MHHQILEKKRAVRCIVGLRRRIAERQQQRPSARTAATARSSSTPMVFGSMRFEDGQQFHVSMLHVPFGPWQPTRAKLHSETSSNYLCASDE